MLRAKVKKGFEFHCAVDNIRSYCKLSAKDKLNWLEEANRFTFKMLPEETKKIWEQFRHGEI